MKLVAGLFVGATFLSLAAFVGFVWSADYGRWEIADMVERHVRASCQYPETDPNFSVRVPGYTFVAKCEGLAMSE